MQQSSKLDIQAGNLQQQFVSSSSHESLRYLLMGWTSGRCPCVSGIASEHWALQEENWGILECKASKRTFEDEVAITRVLAEQNICQGKQSSLTLSHTNQVRLLSGSLFWKKELVWITYCNHWSECTYTVHWYHINSGKRCIPENMRTLSKHQR